MMDCSLQKWNFLLYKMLINGLSLCDYLRIIVTFLSAVWTLFLTAPIHCSESTGDQEM